MSKIKIYSTGFCSFCTKAKALMDGLGIEYTEYNVYDDASAMNIMQEMKFRTVPQICIDDVWIGGFEELTEMHEAGALDNITEGLGDSRLDSNQE